MKSPFISRTQHEAEASRLKDKLRQATEQRAQAAEKLSRMTAKRDQERKRAADLEQLCEARLRAMEHLQADIEDLRVSRMNLLEARSRARDILSPRKGGAIPTILGVDVEPDARVVDLADPSWRATSLFFSKARELRELLRDTASGASVAFTWFPRADPQVEKANGSETWALDHFAREWAEAKAAGDEIGLHMHPWKWDDQTGKWCQDHADEAWVIACVHSSIAAYRRVFGVTPSCYRGGDRYLSNAVVRVLEEEGVKVDMTLERMPELHRLVETELGTGTIPDGTQVPQHAYRPSLEDFRIPAPDKTHGLGMLSLTSHQKGSLPLWVPNTVFEDTLDGILGTEAEGAASAAPTHLAFVVRSNIANMPQWHDFVENTLSLARRVREGRLVFATASETWNMVSR